MFCSYILNNTYLIMIMDYTYIPMYYNLYLLENE